MQKLYNPIVHLTLPVCYSCHVYYIHIHQHLHHIMLSFLPLTVTYFFNIYRSSGWIKKNTRTNCMLSSRSPFKYKRKKNPFIYPDICHFFCSPFSPEGQVPLCYYVPSDSAISLRAFLLVMSPLDLPSSENVFISPSSWRVFLLESHKYIVSKINK